MEDLIRILRTSEMSREMKFAIIALVSSARDERFVNDFIGVIKAWDQADNALEQSLLKKLDTIHEVYMEGEEERQRAVNSELEKIEEEVDRGDSVATLKKSILEK